MKKLGAAGVLFFVFLSIPLGVNLWKIAGRGYSLYEIWPHFLLDAGVMALFFFLLVTKPLENPVLYGALFCVFSVLFLAEHTPETLTGWIASIAVLSVMGIFVFPRLADIMPWVLLGLLIGYYGVLRTYLPELNRDEVMEVLQKKSSVETGREFMRTVLGYERNAIGREKYRYFLKSDSEMTARLKKAGRLHGQTDLMAKGISFLEWESFPARGGSEGIVSFPESTVPCRTIEKADDGTALSCRAHVGAFEVSVQKLQDGTFRVTDFPESIQVSLEQKTVPQF